MNPQLKSILTLLLWIFLSFLFPLGVLGDIIFRKVNKKNLKEKWWTYLVSMIPFIGPIISYIVLH